MLKLIEEINAEISKVIIGKDEIVRKVLMSILSQGHILLEDVPGVGKTTLALAFSKVLGLETSRVQFTSDTMPSDIIGFSVYVREQDSFVYKPGAVMTNLLLADEINRTSSKTQSALLEAMEEKQVSVDGQSHPLPDPFVVIATQNPAGSAGTQMLPSSQLDRFLICASMGYPDMESQMSILKDRHTGNPLETVRQIIDKTKLTELVDGAAGVFISDEVYRYVVDLVEATRDNEMIELGVSPRGALALCRMAKSCAFIGGSDFVTPESIAEVSYDVLCHRLIMSAKARMHHVAPREALSEILAAVKIPQVSGGRE